MTFLGVLWDNDQTALVIHKYYVQDLCFKSLTDQPFYFMHTFLPCEVCEGYYEGWIDII